MGLLKVMCNKRQVCAIIDDLEDANVKAGVTYGFFKEGKTELVVVYDDCDDTLVSGIVKYRMKDYGKG